MNKDWIIFSSIQSKFKNKKLQLYYTSVRNYKKLIPGKHNFFKIFFKQVEKLVFKESIRMFFLKQHSKCKGFSSFKKLRFWKI